MVCAREGCEIIFGKTVHNQKFHDSRCCQLATNARLLEKYYASKVEIPSGRVCATKNCGTVLNRYNKNDYCMVCQDKKTAEILRFEF